MTPFNLLAHAVRAKEIIAVAARCGFSELLDQLELPAGFWQRFIPRPAKRLPAYVRIRTALEDLGPAFIKAGQLLSMRPDALPPALIFELRKLRNNVATLPFSEMRPVLEDALGRPLAEVFSEFDEKPAASASLAQVYFATLHDGREVAVKIQRPGLRKLVETDLALLGFFVNQLHERIETLRPYDLPAVVAEVSAGVLRELDFTYEARNQRFFTATNPNPEHVFAPEIYEEFSSECVLVMQRIVGRPVDSSGLAPEAARALARAGAASLFHQVLVAGFFHADPHAGNVLVTADGRLCFLDWGLAGHLTRRLRHALADLFLAAVDQDAERIVQIAAELGSPAGRADLRSMERDVTLALREDFNRAIGQVNLGRAMLKLLFIFGRNGISITSDYSLMAKAVLSIEEVARSLDPEFDLKRSARPVLVQLQKDRVGPRAILRDTRALLRTTLGGLRDLPAELHRIIRRIEHDELTIKFQHQGLEDLDDALKTSANRIALGFISGCLVIGSSLIVAAKGGALNLLGGSGYVLAAAIAAYVVYGIFREGR
ncbi:MAG: AarF/UbiB family protein [Verrucomicrobia bacterium]|nr:AarF/UbiB family protein [Verrucomicrobiota bacterium]